MTAQIINGRACARKLKDDLTAEMSRLHDSGAAIGLATVLVGDDFRSSAYERRLRRISAALGVAYRHHRVRVDTSEAALIGLIRELNAAPEVSGILMLRPLSGHIDEEVVFQAIDPRKDVEAVHPENAGLLALGKPRFVPSTAAAVFHLLDGWLDTIGEARAQFYHRSSIVIIGRSNNVGKPAISLGLAREATVQSVDVWADRTTGIGRYTRWADVVIVAAGKPGLIKAEHVSENAVVIDVGINPAVDHGGRVRMVGDVEYGSVASRVRAITPVPGGVGPVTDVWLLRNTALAASFLSGVELDVAAPASFVETT